ncbi:carboxymuconolactone decarboxylase family protein [Bacillus sp. USDA818B3_A]|uniref:carboxymuconolactone decarboxylase family protein n=1 Tax=Bacillus sp. USDA818B3_A TaxID=2698834 RepID=UPI00136F2F32|nr:carboxymuconolactone decarboxylase family protein [Bacillus sp. USDA818B3_A]
MSSNEKLSAKVDIDFPDFTKLPEQVRQRYESLPTIVNFFLMMGYSPGTCVEVMDLTDAIFKKLTLSDYHKELLILEVAGHEGCEYEWEQHVSISQAAGVREDQFVAIAERRFDDNDAFSVREQALLRFGKFILEQGKAPAVVFKHTLEQFSLEELADAMIVIGYYKMLSTFIQTFNIPIDAQENGNWIKG